ncbi:MAG: DUF3110 domain-containing protein [Pseudomonadota bacterium]|nr:DUF3110 domain-containing protein [Pseudomonadota bacterium]
MFIITLQGMGDEGAYAVRDEKNENVLYLFVDKDDALRYVGMLDADEFPPMAVTEVEDRQVIATCEQSNCKYSIITPDDLVIPPLQKPDDPVSKDSVEKPPEHG